MTVTARLMNNVTNEPLLLGESSAMRQLHALVAEAAGLDSPVLVTGESGTGKEVVARALHARSQRHAAPFVTLDVSLLGDGDPFAAAVERGGTLFIDDILTMSKALQIALLHTLEMLQERRRVLRMRDVDHHDLRVVCATHGDVHAAVASGAFRRDLYHRIDVLHIELPPLRDRDDDVVLLARHFLALHASRVGKHITGFTAGALAALRAWPWPGNVRELESCVEHAVGLARGGEIDVENIPARIRRAPPRPPPAANDDDLVRLDDVVRRHVLKVLRTTGGNRRQAAQLLGISRRTLYRRLDEWNLTHEDQ